MAVRLYAANTYGSTTADDGAAQVLPWLVHSLPSVWGASALVKNTEALFNTPHTLTLSGLLVNTEIVVIKQSDGSEITSMHVENSTADHALGYVYDGTAPVVDIHLIKPGYKWEKLSGITLGDADQTIPVAQDIDRAYST